MELMGTIEDGECVCQAQSTFMFPVMLISIQYKLNKRCMAYYFLDTPVHIHQAILCHVKNDRVVRVPKTSSVFL